MKKTILTASFLLSTHFFADAQSIASVNTENKNICNSTKTCQPGFQLNTAMIGMQEFIGNEPGSDYDRYMTKSFNKNTGAWFMVIGGTLSLAIGIITANSTPLFPSADERKKADKKENVGNTLAIIGVAAILGSIPLFISSSLYKRKARLLISNQKTGFVIPHKYGKELTGVTLSIPIGK